MCGMYICSHGSFLMFLLSAKVSRFLNNILLLFKFVLLLLLHTFDSMANMRLIYMYIFTPVYREFLKYTACI
jgi:hypothetical protein